MSYSKPKVDESKFIANPLVGSDFKIIVNKVRDSKTFIKDGEDWLPKEYELEKEQITKVYTKAENRLIIAELSSAAQRLYVWLLYEVDAGKDYMWLNRKRYMEENRIKSVNSYKKAVNELSRYLIIYPTLEVKHDYYWINPRLFFSGSRPNKYPKNVITYEETKKPLSE